MSQLGIAGVYYGYVAYDDVAVHFWGNRTELATRDRSTIHATFAAIGAGRHNAGIQVNDTGLVQVFWGGALRVSFTVTGGFTANPVARLATKGLSQIPLLPEDPSLFDGIVLLDFLSYTRSFYRANGEPIGMNPRVEVVSFDGVQALQREEPDPVPLTPGANIVGRNQGSPNRTDNVPDDDPTRREILLALPNGRRTTGILIGTVGHNLHVSDFDIEGLPIYSPAGPAETTVGVVGVVATDAVGESQYFSQAVAVSGANFGKILDSIRQPVQGVINTISSLIQPTLAGHKIGTIVRHGGGEGGEGTTPTAVDAGVNPGSAGTGDATDFSNSDEGNCACRGENVSVPDGTKTTTSNDKGLEGQTDLVGGVVLPQGDISYTGGGIPAGSLEILRDEFITPAKNAKGSGKHVYHANSLQKTEISTSAALSKDQQQLLSDVLRAFDYLDVSTELKEILRTKIIGSDNLSFKIQIGKLTGSDKQAQGKMNEDVVGKKRDYVMTLSADLFKLDDCVGANYLGGMRPVEYAHRVAQIVTLIWHELQHFMFYLQRAGIYDSKFDENEMSGEPYKREENGVEVAANEAFARNERDVFDVMLEMLSGPQANGKGAEGVNYESTPVKDIAGVPRRDKWNSTGSCA